jgi:hypothetical protein
LPSLHALYPLATDVLPYRGQHISRTETQHNVYITEIPGWIPDNKSSSENNYSFKRKGSCFFTGLKEGLECIYDHKSELATDGALIDQLFAKAKLRLIVRDTKDYVALKQE